MRAQIDGELHPNATLGERMNRAQLCELVEKAIAGDKAAFAELYEIKSTHILYQAQQIVRSLADAEDVSQHVALRMYQRIGTLRDPQLFNPWLRKIITNECMRSMKRKYATQDELDIEIVEDGFLEERVEFLPAEFAEKQEFRALLLKVVHELPPKQREVILLYYYEEMSIAEVAAAMETTPNSVAVHMHAARKRIKKELEKQTGQSLDKTYSVGSLAGIPVLKAVFDYDAKQTVTEESIEGFMQVCHRIIESNGSPMVLSSPPGHAAKLAWNAKTTGIIGIGVTTVVLVAAIVASPMVQANAPQLFGPNSSPVQGSTKDPQPSGAATVEEDLDNNDPQGEDPGDQQPGGESAEPPVGTSPTPGASNSHTPGTSTPRPTPTPGAYVKARISGNVVLVDSLDNALAHSGGLLSGLSMVLEDSQGQAVARTTTSANGAYSFGALQLERLQSYVIRLNPDAHRDLSQARGGQGAALYVQASGDMAAEIYLQLAEMPAGLIVLSGGDDDGTYTNPTSALLMDFSPLSTEFSWKIVSALSKEMLHSGTGPLVEEALLQMLCDAPEGLYTIQFLRIDAAGNRDVHNKDFYIARKN